MNKLQKCIDNNKVNTSKSREVIYKILLNSSGCLTVNQIIEKSINAYPKKISINTIYRHLRFFIDCELIFVIQDDLKRSYYCLCRENTMIFSVCTKCNTIKKIEADLCSEFKDSDFITIHNKCQNCK